MSFLPLLSRWLHILAAMAVVGGPMFMCFALLPADPVLPGNQRQALHDRIRRRWSKVVMTAILFLLVTGIYNFILFFQATKTWGPTWEHGSANYSLYNILFGIKFVLALAVFFIASAVTGRGEIFTRFRQHDRFWITVNLLLGILIVCIAGYMRMMHTGPNG